MYKFQNFISSSTHFITTNYQKITDGIAVLNYYYIDDIIEISKQKKVFLWIIFIIYLISELVISISSALVLYWYPTSPPTDSLLLFNIDDSISTLSKFKYTIYI